MNAHRKAIWDRADAEQIMAEAYSRYSSTMALGQKVEANTGLASVHYSLVKRYLSPAPLWVRIFAVWHMWRAVTHARLADNLGLRNADQVDVVSRIFLMAPSWIGGDKRRAEKMIEGVLRPGGEMKDHTRALLFVSLGEIKFQNGMSYKLAKDYFKQAMLSGAKVRKEDEPQLCRIWFGVGRFFAEHGDNANDQSFGIETMDGALSLATRVAIDQVDKIKNETRRILEKIQAGLSAKDATA